MRKILFTLVLVGLFIISASATLVALAILGF